MRSIVNILLTILVVASIACTPSDKKNASEGTSPGVVNLYTHRHYDADKKVLALFTEKTGIEVNVVKASADELINKLELEGESTPADLLFTVDAAKLYRAKDKRLLQKSDLAILGNVPTNLKDQDGYWHGITYRARVIAYDKEKVAPSQLSTYEDLADPKWENKVLIRSSSSGYNQSLLASILHAAGPESAKSWAQGVVKNMAREPQGGDRDQIKAIASGVGELAVVNTYYVGLLLNSSNPEEVKAGEKVGIFFPNQDGRGTHINVSGIGITKHAPNKENAEKLLEFLLSEEAQTVLVNNSFEYPANSKVEPANIVKDFGEFKADALTFSETAANNDEAVKIFDEVGWN